MELWGITDCGKVRRQNQDVFKTLFDEEANIAVLTVCDGMGGANAGNIASQLACDVFMGSMGRFIENIGEREDIEERMRGSVLAANRAVYEKSVFNESCAGMGTTLTAAITTKLGETVVNVGDSRAYIIAGDSISQVTKDHSVVEEMVDRGELTREEARDHPKKNLITRALGTYLDVSPDVFSFSLAQGGYLLLCSDGLSNIVSDEEILAEIRQSRSVRKSCEALLGLALSRGAPDNVTIILFRK